MPIDTAGNTLVTARDILASPGLQTLNERIDSLDTDDYYRFSFCNRSSLSLTLHGLSADAGLQLLNVNGAVIQSATNTGAIAEALNTILDPGTYYIRVSPGITGAETDYTLNVTVQVNSQADISWRDYSSGTSMFWNMGSNIPLSSWNLPYAVPSDWTLEAVVDFNRDHHPDLLWRNPNTGVTTVWFMGGSNHASYSSLTYLPTVPTNWAIEGVADFNGDNQPDLVWRDYTSGTNTVWFMGGSSGTTMTSWRYLPAVPTTWSIRGIADFNGDNRPDLIWRDLATGTNTVWFMGGTSNTLMSTWNFIAAVSPNWSIEGVADLNNDTRPDIIWRDYTTGMNTVWFMGGSNGTSVSSWRFLPDMPTTWRAVPYNRFETPDLIDLAGNTTTTAFNIGTLNGSGAFSDRVHSLDQNDYYRFNLSTASSFNLTLNGLSNNTDVQLLNQFGGVILTSSNGGITAETMNLQLASGTYYIRVYPATGAASNYSLNVAATSAIIDLRGAFFDVPEPLTAGNSTTVSFRLQNAGTSTAGPFRVSFYLSSDNVVTTSDRLLTAVDISSLGANTTTSTLSTSFTLPGIADAFWSGSRTYYIGMIVDSLSAVIETNETNNANLGNSIDWDDIAITVPVPDLQGVFFDATPEPLTAGNTLTANFRVQNTSTASVGGFRVNFYLSTDSTISTSDRLLDYYDIASLAGNTTTSTLARSLTLPGATDSFWLGNRTYYIGMIVDALNAITESNETNNANLGNSIDWDDVAITIPVPNPDLQGVFFDATPEPLTAGNTLTANFQVRNTSTTSAGGFRVNFYLSTDSTISTSDRLLDYYDIASLAGNTTTSTLSRTLTLPSATDSFWLGNRTYYIGIIVDALNAITESNETNNANLGNSIDWDDIAITVTITAPTVGTVNPTGNLAIDALLAASPYNYYWNTSANGGIITYSFLGAAGGAAYYGSETVSEVNDAIKTNVRNILSMFESYINIRFVEVADTATNYGVLRYMFSNGPGYAYAYYPSTHPLGGDVHLNQAYESDSYNRFSGGYGTHGFMTLIHETFHALGLKHPGNYNGSGTGEGPFLAGGDDNTTNTVMSYNFAGNSAITPMAYDVRALQYIYGAKSTNSTNNTYAFSTVYGYNNGGQFFGSTTTALKQTIWDSGGSDTLDFSGLSATTSYRFDLREGGILTTQAAYNTYSYSDRSGGGTFTTSSYGTAIAYNTVIENLVNSRGSDLIIANSASNIFRGYTLGTATGNDVIELSSAADVLELTGYSLANLIATVSGSNLTISLGANGSIQIKDYYGASGSMKTLIGGSYYTYNATTGWQVTTAPTIPNHFDAVSSGGLTAMTLSTNEMVFNPMPPIACNCPICTGKSTGMTMVGQSSLAELVGVS